MTIKASLNDISFDFIPFLNDILSTSVLELYISLKVSFESPLLCTWKQTVLLPTTDFTSACIVTSFPNYLVISMRPNVLLSGISQTIKLSGLRFDAASNHEDASFELFFRLHKDPSNMSAFIYDFMIPLTVIQLPAVGVET